MDFVKNRVKVLENFKDGNILGGRFLRAGEILVLSESDCTKIQNSGGLLEVMEILVPNPRVVEAVKVEEVAPEVVEEPKIAPKRRGRPKKNEA